MGLANVLYGQGNKEQGIKLMRKVCKNLNVHLNIDPFLGEQGGVKVKRDLIDHITEKFSGIEYAFHPSYLSEAGESNYFESWKHLIHIHIEKCAGTNFIQPLVELANLLNYEKNNNKRLNVAILSVNIIFGTGIWGEIVNTMLSCLRHFREKK